MIGDKVVVYTNDCSSELAGRVTLLAGVVESTSLYLLRAIEDTVSSLRRLEEFARSMASNALATAEDISACPVEAGKFVDPDHAAIEKLEAAIEGIDKHIPVIEAKKTSIDGDNTLQPHHCEILHAAYGSYLSTLEGLTEAAKILRSAIIRHDLAAEDVNSAKRYSSADDLIADLNC